MTGTAAQQATAGQAAYEARQRSHWKRHGMPDGAPLPTPWAALTDDQRADEEAAASAAIRCAAAADGDDLTWEQVAAKLALAYDRLGDAAAEAAPVTAGELAAFGKLMERSAKDFEALRVRLDAEVAEAVKAERERIREAAEGLKFTLFRPGNGPAQTQALDVVPLADLPGLLKGGSDDD